MGREEKIVIGIRKVYKYANDYAGSDKMEFLEQDVFITKVPLDNLCFETTMLNGGIDGGTNARNIEDLLLFSINNPGLNTMTTKTKLEIPQRTIERWIRELKKNGEIEFRGSNKTGGYFII
jgi:ATP-dependent DNA helicase RecG